MKIDPHPLGAPALRPTPIPHARPDAGKKAFRDLMQGQGRPQNHAAHVAAGNGRAAPSQGPSVKAAPFEETPAQAAPSNPGLEDAGPGRGDSRAFGFAELGLFGRSGALATPSAPGAPAPPPGPPSTAPLLLAAVATVRDLAPSPPAGTDPRRPGPVGAAPTALLATGPGKASADLERAADATPDQPPPPAGEGGLEPDPADGGLVFAPSGAQTRPRAARRGDPSASGPRLMVFEDSGQLSIGLAAPGLDAEDGRDLRDRLASTAAEFGLDLQELLLNGASVPGARQVSKEG